MEVANEQSLKGDFWMAQRLRNGVVSLQRHDGEFTFTAKHGLLMGTSEAPSIFSWSFERTGHSNAGNWTRKLHRP